MNRSDNNPDWTAGVPALVFEHCPACRATWYFRRPACPECGRPDPERRIASGRGVVYARTVVRRAPTPALRSLAPYCVVLVDAEEGFRLMAHAPEAVAIGERVSLRIVPFGDAIVPFADRTEPAA